MWIFVHVLSSRTNIMKIIKATGYPYMTKLIDENTTLDDEGYEVPTVFAISVKSKETYGKIRHIGFLPWNIYDYDTILPSKIEALDIYELDKYVLEDYTKEATDTKILQNHINGASFSPINSDKAKESIDSMRQAILDELFNSSNISLFREVSISVGTIESMPNNKNWWGTTLRQIEFSCKIDANGLPIADTLKAKNVYTYFGTTGIKKTEGNELKIDNALNKIRKSKMAFIFC